jgi:hypothetical protein
MPQQRIEVMIRRTASKRYWTVCSINSLILSENSVRDFNAKGGREAFLNQQLGLSLHEISNDNGVR